MSSYSLLRSLRVKNNNHENGAGRRRIVVVYLQGAAAKPAARAPAAQCPPGRPVPCRALSVPPEQLQIGGTSYRNKPQLDCVTGMEAGLWDLLGAAETESQQLLLQVKEKELCSPAKAACD